MSKITDVIIGCAVVALCASLRAQDAPLGADLARLASAVGENPAKALVGIEQLLARARNSPEITCQTLLVRLNAHRKLHNSAGMLEDAAAIAQTGQKLNHDKADDLALAVFEATHALQGSQAAADSIEKYFKTIADEPARLGNLRLRQANVCIDIVHDYETAGAILENLRAKNTDFAKAADVRLIDLSIARNDPEEAIARSRKVLEMRASQMTRIEEMNLRQRLGDLLLAAKQYDEARGAYTKVLADLTQMAGPKAQADDRKRMAAVAMLVGNTYPAAAGAEEATRTVAAGKGTDPQTAADWSQSSNGKAVAHYRAVLAAFPDCRENCFAAQKAICARFHDAKQYDKALVAAVRLYDAADNPKAIGEALPCILREMHALDGNCVRLEAFVAFLKAASEGVGPTPLKNPLDQYFETAPALKPDVEEDALLQAALAKLGNSTQDGTLRGTLYLYFGLPRAAVSQFKKVFIDCNFDQKSLQAAADDVAVGLKAYFGHLGAAAEFFEFQEFGPQGKDGQAKLRNVLNEF